MAKKIILDYFNMNLRISMKFNIQRKYNNLFFSLANKPLGNKSDSGNQLIINFISSIFL